MDKITHKQDVQPLSPNFQPSDQQLLTQAFNKYHCKETEPFPIAFIPGDTKELYLTQFNDSLTGRTIKEYPSRIQSWSFPVQQETIIDEIVSNPAAFRKCILSRRTPDKVDTFPFPEMAQLVANIRTGAGHFLMEADDDERGIYTDFVGTLDNIQTSGFIYRDIMYACYTFVLLADYHHFKRGRFTMATRGNIPNSPEIKSYAREEHPHHSMSELYHCLKRVIEKSEGAEQEFSEMDTKADYFFIYAHFSENLKKHHLLYIPTFMPLDTVFFRRTAPFLLLGTSLLNSTLLHADNWLTSPHFLFMHDSDFHPHIINDAHFEKNGQFKQTILSHCKETHWEEQTEDVFQVIETGLSALPPSLYKAADILLFYRGHENVTPWVNLPRIPSHDHLHLFNQFSRVRAGVVSDGPSQSYIIRVLYTENPCITDAEYLGATLFIENLLEEYRKHSEPGKRTDPGKVIPRAMTLLKKQWQPAATLWHLGQQQGKDFIPYLRVFNSPVWTTLSCNLASKEKDLCVNIPFKEGDNAYFFLLSALRLESSEGFLDAYRCWLAQYPHYLQEASINGSLDWLRPETFLPSALQAVT